MENFGNKLNLEIKFILKLSLCHENAKFETFIQQLSIIVNRKNFQ